MRVGGFNFSKVDDCTIFEPRGSMRFALPGRQGRRDGRRRASERFRGFEPTRHWCTAMRAKKGAVAWDRAEDSTIGGEWRNSSAVPKEEDGWPRTVTIIPYCAAQCKTHNSGQETKGAIRGIDGVCPYNIGLWGGCTMKTRVKWLEDVSFRRRDRQRPRGRRRRRPRGGRPQHRHAPDGAVPRRRRGMHGVRRRLDPEARATAGCRLRRRGRRRARAGGAEGVHADPSELCGGRPRPRSCAGRAGGEAVQGEVLLGDDHARAPPRSPTTLRIVDGDRVDATRPAAAGSGSTCPSGRRRAPAPAHRAGRRAR